MLKTKLYYISDYNMLYTKSK